MFVDVDRKHFEAVIRGKDLADMPNLDLFCPPLINTNTHSLAKWTPEWVFKVKQQSPWGRPSTPRISIYKENNPTIGLSFRIRCRPLYQSLAQVFEDLKRADFQLRPRTLNVETVIPKDLSETELLDMLKKKVSARIKTPVKKRIFSAEIFRFEDYLQQLENEEKVA